MAFRPKYETAANLAKEAMVIRQVCARFKFDAVKLPINCRADYMLSQGGNAKVMAEVKVKTNPKDKYPTYMVSKGKYDALLAWVDMGFEAALFVQWRDALGYVKLPVEHTLATGGRRDRDDPLDIELVVMIDVGLFKII